MKGKDKEKHASMGSQEIGAQGFNSNQQFFDEMTEEEQMATMYPADLMGRARYLNYIKRITPLDLEKYSQIYRLRQAKDSILQAFTYLAKNVIHVSRIQAMVVMWLAGITGFVVTNFTSFNLGRFLLETLGDSDFNCLLYTGLVMILYGPFDAGRIQRSFSDIIKYYPSLFNQDGSVKENPYGEEEYLKQGSEQEDEAAQEQEGEQEGEQKDAQTQKPGSVNCQTGGENQEPVGYQPGMENEIAQQQHAIEQEKEAEQRAKEYDRDSREEEDEEDEDDNEQEQEQE